MTRSFSGAHLALVTATLGRLLSWTIKVYRRPAMLGGYLGFSLADGQSIFAKFQESITADFPDEFSGDFLCANMLHIGPTILMLYTWVQEDGDLTRAKAHFEKFQGFGDTYVEHCDRK